MLRKIWTVMAVMMAFAVVTTSGSTGAMAQSRKMEVAKIFGIMNNPKLTDAQKQAQVTATLASNPTIASAVVQSLLTTVATKSGNAASATTTVANLLVAVAKSDPALTSAVGSGMGSAQKTLTVAGVQTPAAQSITNAVTAAASATPALVTSFNTTAAVTLPNPSQTATNNANGSPQ